MLGSAKRRTSGDQTLTVQAVGEALLSDRLISAQQSERLRFLAEQDGGLGSKHPLVFVAEQGWSSASDPPFPLEIERLMRWLAVKAGLPYLRIDPLKIDVAAVTGVMKHAYAERYGILPVGVSGKRVTIATAQPFVREWERELGRIHGLEFERVLANPLAIERYLGDFYALSQSISGAQSERAGTAGGGVTANWEQLVELGQTGEIDANDAHVVRIVDWMLQHAFEQRASDIHLEPRREKGRVRFRIDGVLHLVNEIPTPVMTGAVSRIKAIARLDVVERRRPQDGRIKTKAPGGKEVELRLSTMPTAFGEKLVMRIFDPDVLVKSFAELGFSDHETALWDRMVAQPHGMIIVTGPTGSGKTTTLYSALKQLARPELNLCTIEDPIEQVDPHLNQMNVQTNIGLDFASGVRTLLRQDPDIIMVGEIRDAETAETAIQAALTGHLVLTTLHTNGAPATIMRLLDLGAPPYLIKAALLGIVAQRLVRTLCPHCKRPTEIPPDQWTSLVAPFEVPPPARPHEAVGCDECRHTGYRGRVAIYEILAMSEPVRKGITAEGDGAALRAAALKGGMRPLRISGANKVSEGVTTPEEVFAVAQEEES